MLARSYLVCARAGHLQYYNATDCDCVRVISSYCHGNAKNLQLIFDCCFDNHTTLNFVRVNINETFVIGRRLDVALWQNICMYCTDFCFCMVICVAVLYVSEPQCRILILLGVVECEDSVHIKIHNIIYMYI